MAIQTNFPNLKPTLLLDFANVKALDPRITFTRASEGRYYDGKTFSKAEENLLLQSEDFTNTTYWATNGASVSFTANTSIAPNGATTADTMTAAAGTGNRYGSGTAFYPITSGLVYTASLFVKAGTDTVVQLILPTAQFGSTAFANFDVSGGVLGTVGATATAAISNAGNGWYRCSVTATATGSSTASIGFGFVFVANNTSAARLPSITAAGTETLLIWGAQLEQRSSVTAYTATTTQPITNYIPVLMTAASGVARFDHNPVTEESLGLLIEEQRTNLLLQSETFSTTWAATRCSITANTIVAPDGALTADKLVEDATASDTHLLTQSISFTSGTAYTYSIFAKQAEAGRFFQLLFPSAAFGSALRATFDLKNGTFQVSASITGAITFVGNGWYRCSITGTATTTASASIGILLANSSAATGAAAIYTGDGYSGVYIWGAQLEVGAFATSYIPTVASQVTRAADAASMTGTNFSSWWRPDEGTFVATSAAVSTGTFRRIVSADDGTSNNIIYLSHSNDNARGFVIVNGVAEASFTSSTFSGNFGTEALGYKFNNVGFAFNGTLSTTDTAATIPVVNRLNIGSAIGTSNFLNGHIRKIAFYPARVTNEQLQALTS